MKLSERKLSQLKEMKEKDPSCRVLYDRYLYTERSGLEAKNIQLFMTNNLCTFKELVDAYKELREYWSESRCLCYLIENDRVFQWLITYSQVNDSDLKYLLNKIDNIKELLKLSRNTYLIKHLLDNFVLDENIVSNLNTISQYTKNSTKLESADTLNVFDFIEYYNDDTHLLELIDSTKLVFSLTFNDTERKEIFDLIQHSEYAKNMLRQVVESNLEDQYNFETLRRLLTKDAEKRKTKLNL